MHRALAIQDGFTEDVAVIIDREDPSPAAVLRTCSAQDTTLSLLKLCHPSFRVINGNVDDPLIAHNKQHDTWCQNAWMDSDSTPLDVKRINAIYDFRLTLFDLGSKCIERWRFRMDLPKMSL